MRLYSYVSSCTNFISYFGLCFGIKSVDTTSSKRCATSTVTWTSSTPRSVTCSSSDVKEVDQEIQDIQSNRNINIETNVDVNHDRCHFPIDKANSNEPNECKRHKPEYNKELHGGVATLNEYIEEQKDLPLGGQAAYIIGTPCTEESNSLQDEKHRFTIPGPRCAMTWVHCYLNSRCCICLVELSWQVLIQQTSVNVF